MTPLFRLSAFADEVSPDPATQLAVLGACGVRFVEFRSVNRVNVLAMGEPELADFRKRLEGAGVGVSAIGSPVGKVPIDAPFGPHFDRFKHAVELAQRFGTANVRVFSYYPPADTPFAGDWSPYRSEIVDRMRQKAEYAGRHGVRLLHENEHKIYGDTPARVRDLLEGVNSPHLRAAYDAANFVYVGSDPLDGWHQTRDFTDHFHIKDWLKGGDHGVLAGHGDGQWPVVLRDAVARGYSGFAVLEPHLRGGGPTGGVTGADLFPAAAEALRKLLAAAGATEG